MKRQRQHHYRALTFGEKHEYSVEKLQVPVPGDTEIVVRNFRIGLNPVDWKSVEFRFGIYGYPWINGRESVGLVVRAGSKVTRFRERSRVLLVSTNYRDLRTSTFQEFSVCEQDLAIDIGDMDYSLAIGYGVPLVTSIITLDTLFQQKNKTEKTEKEKYQSNPDKHRTNSASKQQPPENSKTPRPFLLIWGGACCTGIFACQIAKRNGLGVVSVASKKSAEYVKNYGADVVLDRLDISTGSEIIAKTPGLIIYGIDCVGKDSAAIVMNTLAQTNGLMISLVAKVPQCSEVRLCELDLKRFHEDTQYGNKISLQVEILMRELKPPKLHFLSGIENIPLGLRQVRMGKPGKVVVRID